MLWFPAVRGKRVEEGIDRHVAAALGPGHDAKDAGGNGQIELWRDYVDAVGGSANVAVHLGDGHFALV